MSVVDIQPIEKEQVDSAAAFYVNNDISRLGEIKDLQEESRKNIATGIVKNVRSSPEKDAYTGEITGYTKDEIIALRKYLKLGGNYRRRKTNRRKNRKTKRRNTKRRSHTKKR
jgi:hypothetical protein